MSGIPVDCGRTFERANVWTRIKVPSPCHVAKAIPVPSGLAAQSTPTIGMTRYWHYAGFGRNFTLSMVLQEFK